MDPLPKHRPSASGSVTLSGPRAAGSGATTREAPPPAHDEAAREASGLRVVARDAFAIEGEVGRGGLGRVLLAREPGLDRSVAIKEALRDEPGAEARFVREARLTARLQHPNIVPVYEAGRWPSGEPFYAMRLISGLSLIHISEPTRPY